MEFFNKKEEVLDVELTEYGKYLLSIGQLDPAYYAFFDDDVLYDVSGSGYTEAQNDIERRIQYDTPQLKILANRTGVETRVGQFLADLNLTNAGRQLDPANKVTQFRNQEPFANKGKINAYPLGNSSIDSKYNPAWQLEVLSEPEISSSARYLQEGGSGRALVEQIPQININVDYEVFFGDRLNMEKSITGLYEDTNVYLALNDNYLLLELLENNTNYEKENFSIEVFESGSGANGVGEYTQKSFFPTSGPEFTEPTSSHVEYYMNILVDGEIDRAVGDLDFGARPSAGPTKLRFNRNLYLTDNEEPCD